MEHKPILVKPILEALNIKADGVYVDCTFGRGGHSTEILKRLSSGRLIAIDQDSDAVESAKNLQKQYPNLTIVHDNFRHLKSILELLDLGSVDGILIDLGVSSPQFDDEERGFSYRNNHRLDMRMDTRQSLDAYTVVNTYRFEDLFRCLKEYGEEPYAKQIARKIEQVRLIKPIETTFELVDVIKSALPSKVLSQKGHPAKQSFQALRIEVNDELSSLDDVLNQAISALKPDGRLAVLSFHSLEDRRVKRVFLEHCTVYTPKNLPLKDLPKASYELLTKHAVIADEEERLDNPRSHSAKLRVLKKVNL